MEIGDVLEQKEDIEVGTVFRGEDYGGEYATIVHRIVNNEVYYYFYSLNPKAPDNESDELLRHFAIILNWKWVLVDRLEPCSLDEQPRMNRKIHLFERR